MKNLLFLLLVLLVFAGCEKDSASPLDSEPSQSVEFRSSRGKIDVCHYSEEEDSWHLINISLNAWQAHASHGDVRLDDQDGDGFVPNNECGFTGDKGMGDCNDNDDSLNPETVWYLDADGDGYAAGTLTQCLSPGDGYTMTVLPEGDCDDKDAEVNPGAEETPYNGKDDDCDPSTADDDLDGDGFSIANDCDDDEAAIYPGAEEICDDGIDNNCNGEVDEGCAVLPEICETFEGGVVFYVLETPTDLDGDGTPDQGLVAAPASSEIVRESWDGTKTYCEGLVIGGYDDWFLPSKEQLNWMWENLVRDGANCGNFASDNYWSSTELDGSNGAAWFQSFFNGSQNIDDFLNGGARVRAVRTF